MAGKGISLSVAADTRDVLRGIKTGVVEPLEDASAELKALAKAGDKTADQLEDSMRAAQKDTERLTEDYQQLSREIRQSGSSSKTFSADIGQSTAEAGETVREFGDEAKQNIAETFSSFRGEAQDFAQIAQDTFGGVIGSLGPIGAVAGAAGALGIGLLMAEFENAEAASEEFRQRVSDLATEFIETGGIGETSLEYVVERLKELATTSEEGKQNLADLYRDAQGSVTGFRRIAEAYAGNTEALEEYLEKEREQLEIFKQQRNDPAITWNKELQAQIIERAKAQERIVTGLEDSAAAAEEAQVAEQAWLASSGPALEARATAIDTLQGELDEAIGTWGDYQDKETGALDPAGYIAAMDARMAATTNFNSNVQKIADEFGLSFEETQAILDQGVEFAPMLQSIIDSGLAEEFTAQVQAAIGGGQEIIEGNPLGATVSVEADTGAAIFDLDGAAEDRTTQIEAVPKTSKAEKQIDEVAGKKRTATITAQVDLEDARRQLTNFITEQRTTVITATIRDREGREVP